MTVLALAGVSARLMAEAAARDGFEVIALDLFGDVDTCRVASRWFPIGAPGAMHIAAEPVLAALAMLARRGDVVGWVAGGGFEGQPELLEEGAALLPLIGTAPDAIRRVRDPALFFEFLGDCAIQHPAVQLAAPAPADGEGWLLKNSRGCGGWHIRRAAAHRHEPLPLHHYLQREAAGVPMSATFVANGRDAVVLGCNQLTVRAFGTRPHVYCGAIGPVPVAAEVGAQVGRIVRALAEAFTLKGLCSLDFLLDGSALSVLEVNPRPPASMALYGGQALMTAHWFACTEGRLPEPPPPPARVEGIEIIFAKRSMRLDDLAARCLADWPHAHDLPCTASRFVPGDPVCSLSASGIDAADVQMHLNDRRKALAATLERFS